MKPTREWDGRIGRAYWWIRVGKTHTHVIDVLEAKGDMPGWGVTKVTHSHHFPLRIHTDWSAS